jgi:hypothetical protein
MTASGDGELTGDGGEDKFHLIAQPDQDGDCDDGNKSEDQGVLGQGLAPLAFLGSPDFLLVVHDVILTFSNVKSARRGMKIV